MAISGLLLHREWLAAIADNLAAETPKLVYADWLEERGHDQSAHFVRAFVEASRSMKIADFPDAMVLRRSGWS